ncbi:hypothetical protein [Akkermansia glycaniphila]|uniref:Uncharacterized protein n=1 Tax=Akkermansia glycaniphila TaxID=1679444 RepID=A0A1C7PA13_9BACT|nr:hypothetical protein [Akkermansia glycaniphila]OCA02319.1 hypothetical protein AC781_10835 [Akkermansia glycaniphila]OCA04195.1 hypothetical protein AC781_00435 [Akkermansia glycaniphila]SEH87616.1 Hypothetical protein PYTT_1386 [Akkermansia glycaniphila]
MAATKHYIETVAGVTRHMILRLANQDGTPATAADYAIYGAARLGDRIHPFGAAPMDPSSVRLSIPPLVASNYAYDLYAKHTATGVEHALLCGSIRVADRVASMPPADQGGEHIEASISSDLTAITVTVQIVPVITAATWEAIEGSIATADSLLETASNLLPAARQEIATATGTAKQHITAHAAVETAAAKKEINQTAGQAAADTADIIAASGEAALESISSAEATVIAQATNDGINAIGQSITAGTGTISDATASGKSSIDTYIATTQADLARKSQPNIWSGVNTFNAPVVANGGIIIQPTAAASSVGTHMSAWLWASTYCTERAIPYIGRWTSAAWTGNDCLMESYTVPDQSTYHHRLTCMARVDVAYLTRRRNCMDEAKSRIACGIETRPASTYTPHAGTYPWDWASGNELRIVDTPRHAVRCMMIRHAYSVLGSVPTSWRLIYPGRLDDLHSLQIISRGTEWHAPVYIGCHAGNLYAVECSYSQATNPAVTSDVGQYSSIMSRGTLWVSRTYLSDRANQDKQDVPPAITIHAHTIPLRNWTTYKRWPEEQALLEAADKSWVDWRYVTASLDYTPAGSETVIVAANIGRHVYVTAAAQDIGLSASVYRPKAGDDTLLPDGVVVDIDTAATWLTHSGGALHLAANTTGAERIASVWLYSASFTGTIYELQIHQST